MNKEQKEKGLKRMAQRRKDMPELYRKLYDRCISGKASPRDAIKMHCLECWGWFRVETASCDNISCPLWAYRPYQKNQSARQGEEESEESNNDD